MHNGVINSDFSQNAKIKVIPPICVLFVEMRPKARPELQIGNAIGRWDCGLKVSQSQKENLKFSFENRTTEQKYFCISSWSLKGVKSKR